MQEAASDNIYIVEDADFKSDADALINGDVIGISKNVKTNRKRACVLAEELGHYHTTVGNILEQNNDRNRKQEQQARLWSYNKLIGLNGIINSYRHGCRNLAEMAEYLDITEEFLMEAIQKYHSKYGIFTKIDNYAIYFEPTLAVMEITAS